MTNSLPSYRGYRVPAAIIGHAVWLYHRVGLRVRAVEELLADWGVNVTDETIRKWYPTFGIDDARRLSRRRGRMGDNWNLDERSVKIQGRQQYLWCAVDEAGDVICILVQSRRNRWATSRFFRKLLKGHGREPHRLITDQLRSYAAAHRTRPNEDNRAKLSHQPPRQRERQMRRFKSAAPLRRVASVHGVV